MLRRTAFAGTLLVSVRFLTRLSDLATMMVLARLLDPSSFGLVAIATSIILIVEASMELPVNNVLLRHTAPSADHFDTAFTLGAARGLFLAVILFCLSIPVADFYHDVRLIPLVCALALGPMFRSFGSPRMIIFQRELSFWRDFVIEIVAKLAAAAVAITVAIVTRSYWAIVIGSIVAPFIMATISFIFAPYRPRLGVKHLSEFTDFLGWMSLAQIISAINFQSDRLLLGKLQPAARLGLYSTANDAASIPFQAIFAPLWRPIYATFSRLQDDQAGLNAAYKHTSAAILAIGLPILIGQACVAQPTVELLLGPKWLAVIPYLRWLSISFIPALYAYAANPLFISFGDTRLLFRRNLLEICCKLPAVVVGAIYFNFAGVIAARFFSEVMANVFCIIHVRRLIGVSVRDQMIAGWRSPVSAAFMAAVVLAAQAHVPDDANAVSALLQLAILVPLGVAAYGYCHVALWALAGMPAGPERSVFAIVRRLDLRAPLRRLSRT